MRIAWTPAAAEDLEQIADFLFEQNASTAIRSCPPNLLCCIDAETVSQQGAPRKKAGDTRTRACGFTLDHHL